MTAIREALDSFPLGHLLRPGLGRMDLRPSLAKHLEAELDEPAPAPADPAIGQLVDALVDLRDQWRTQANQIMASSTTTADFEAKLGMQVRAAVLGECANALQHVLEGDG